MLLALDQVREVFRDDGALELGRRSSALTLAVGRVQRFSEFVIGLVPQRPAFGAEASGPAPEALIDASAPKAGRWGTRDRKSTRLNSSHVAQSYSVFRLHKNKP